MYFNVHCEHLQSAAYSILPYLSGIGTVINLITLYIIFFHSQQSMRIFSRYLFYYQVFSSLCDLMLADLTTPILIFPNPGGTPIGLLRMMGVDTRIQIAFAFSLIVAMLSGVGMMLIFRTNMVLPAQNRFKMSQRTLAYCSISWLILVPGCTFFILIVVVYKNRREDATIQFPAYYKCVTEDPYFFIFDPINQSIVILFSSAFCFLLIAVFIVCVTSSLYYVISANDGRSMKTRRVQRNGMIILVMQVLLPLSTCVVPICAALSFVILHIDVTFLSKSTPWFLLFLAHHGVLASLVTLSVTNQYRRVICHYTAALFAAIRLKNVTRTCTVHPTTTCSLSRMAPKIVITPFT